MWSKKGLIKRGKIYVQQRRYETHRRICAPLEKESKQDEVLDSDTLPEKIEETARSSKTNKAAEPIAEWKDEVISTVVSKLNLNPKQENQQLSKDDPKFGRSKVDDICVLGTIPILEFVMARFPESDRKHLNTLGDKVRDRAECQRIGKNNGCETEY
ncbi:hypothetical protein OUZ56_033679 [Daphnia magna]|uniref:Uncharacterized protein n=1 Tax=Daphnia magna TaxID=35525 RepID=A0ABQ9ZY57_9CRUS|nr:hypothetical protein OUZ56_033679 [Daphnia magna]